MKQEATIVNTINARVDEVYAALNQMLNGDPTAMLGLWSHQPDVTAMFSVGGRLVGWDSVRAALMKISDLQKRAGMVTTVTPSDVHVNVETAMAYALIHETTVFSANGQQVTVNARTTMVFRPEGPAWNIVHLHNDSVGSIEQMFSMLVMNL